MRTLSPADQKHEWRSYVLFIATISREASYVRVLRELKNHSSIVSHDEENRRIVVKVPLSHVSEASSILRHAASSLSAEIKFGTPLPRRIPMRKCLEEKGYTVSRHGRRILVFRAFNDSSILVEIIPGRMLAKYGRRTMLYGIQPGQIPPSLFTFSVSELSSSILESARLRFMNIRDDVLRCIQVK